MKGLQLRNKMSVAATLVSLGGLTTVALRAGATGRRNQPRVPAAAVGEPERGRVACVAVRSAAEAALPM